jgi:hypothetical protein
MKQLRCADSCSLSSSSALGAAPSNVIAGRSTTSVTAMRPCAFLPSVPLAWSR